MFQCIPNGSNINRTISVDIKVPSIFDNSPRHGRFFLLDIIRELGNQFTNLNNAHTAGILEKVVIFKCGKVMMIPLQIIRNPPAVHNDFPENNLITHFDRATPLLSESFPKSRDRKPPL